MKEHDPCWIEYEKVEVVAFLLGVIFLVGCGATPFGYPFFWDQTSHKPHDTDLIGTYQAFSVSGNVPEMDEFRKTKRLESLKFTLKADHIAILFDMPGFDGFGHKQNCFYSGESRWQVDDMISDGTQWYIELMGDKGKPLSGCYTGASLMLLGRKSPHRAYLTIGDPDSDIGIEFKRIR